MLENAGAIRLPVLFAASTGLRASEQWALRWRHVDCDGAVVKVETRVDRHGVEDVTKSMAGTREVPIGKALVAELKAWREASPFNGDDDLVFPNSEGGYTSHSNFSKRDFADLRKKVD